MADQLGDVLAALAERRNADRKDVEPVVEVLTEGAGLDEVDQAAIGRRDEPEVHPHRPARAHRVDLAVLKGAEKLDLDVERQLADLVEEERAAIRLAELADMLLGGAGEGALLMAEEDRFDQGRGDRTAIEGDEGPGAAVAGALDGAGDEFLPDPRFALDEDGDLRCRGPPAEGDDALHGRAAGDDVGEGQGAGGTPLHALDFALERTEAKRVLDRHLEAVRRDRLDDEIGGPGAHRGDHRLDPAMGGLDDHRQEPILGAEPGEDRHAVDLRHHQVEDHQRHRLAVRRGQLVDRLPPRTRGERPVAEALDRVAEQAALDRIVVDDEDGGGHGADDRPTRLTGT